MKEVEHVPPEDIEVMPEGFAKQLAWDTLYKEVLAALGGGGFMHFNMKEPPHDNQQTAPRSDRTLPPAP